MQDPYNPDLIVIRCHSKVHRGRHCLATGAVMWCVVYIHNIWFLLYSTRRHRNACRIAERRLFIRKRRAGGCLTRNTTRVWLCECGGALLALRLSEISLAGWPRYIELFLSNKRCRHSARVSPPYIHGWLAGHRAQSKLHVARITCRFRLSRLWCVVSVRITQEHKSSISISSDTLIKREISRSNTLWSALSLDLHPRGTAQYWFLVIKRTNRMCCLVSSFDGWIPIWVWQCLCV